MYMDPPVRPCIFLYSCIAPRPSAHRPPLHREQGRLPPAHTVTASLPAAAPPACLLHRLPARAPGRATTCTRRPCPPHRRRAGGRRCWAVGAARRRRRGQAASALASTARVGGRERGQSAARAGGGSVGRPAALCNTPGVCTVIN